MSSKMDLIPSEDVFEIWMERKGKKTKAAKGKNSSSNTEPTSDADLQETLPSGQNRKKMAAVLDVSDCSDDVVHLSISADTCAQTHYKSCAAEVEKLLFEGDKKRLESTGGVDKAIEKAAEYTFQHYQVMLYLKKRLGEMGSALKKASSEHDTLVEEIRSSKQCWSNKEKALMDELACKDEEIFALRSEMSVMRSKMSAMRVMLEARKEQIKDIFLEMVILTRGKDYQEYAEGKASAWDTAKAIRQMKSVLRARDGLPDDKEDEAPGDAAGEGDDDEEDTANGGDVRPVQ